jgi:hypothetical protein
MKHVFLTLLACVPILAGPVTVLNSSFETANLAITIYPQGPFSQIVPGTPDFGGTVANWTAINTTPGNYIGAYDPTPGGNNWSFTWETGNNVGYVQSLGTGATNAGLSQILSAVLTANTTYTLQVDVGRRTFTLPVWNYSIELWANGVQLGSAFNFPGMTANSVNVETLSVTIGASHAQMGQALQIRLMTNGNNTEAFFDNVRLDASPTIPEPGTYGLFALGAGLCGVRRLRNTLSRS